MTVSPFKLLIYSSRFTLTLKMTELNETLKAKSVSGNHVMPGLT